MLINEIFQNQLNEYGYRGFGGYGQSFFRQAYYIAIANLCARGIPTPVKDTVVQWFADAFSKDNPKFKADVFIKACDSGASGKPVKWEQRHFYYLAECIKQIQSETMKEYIATLLTDYFYRGPGNFMKSRWYKYCGVPDPDATEELKKIGQRKEI